MGDIDIEQALKDMVVRKRAEYLAEAVLRGIITDEQAAALHSLFLEQHPDLQGTGPSYGQ